MNPLAIKVSAAITGLGLVFYAGMRVESWQRDSAELEEVKQAKARYVAAVEKSEQVASAVQTQLDRLAATKEVITKEITHEVRKTEYRCSLPDSGRLLYSRAARGDTAVARDLQKSMQPAGDPAP